MLGVSDPNAPQPNNSESTADQPKAERRFRIPFNKEGAKKSEKESQNARSATGFISQIVTSFSKALNRTRELAPVETTTELEISAWLENLSREVRQESQSTEKSRPVPEKKTSTKKASHKKSAPKKSAGQGASSTKRATSTRKSSK
jgi:hypothetical protein